MFIGEYQHSLDEKKRISLPVKFRKELGKKIVVTRGLDNCLFAYPLKGWQKISEKLGSLGMGQADTRGFGRFMLSGAVEVDCDSAGRLLIPDYLRQFAKLGDSVVFAGVGSRIELWNADLWRDYKQTIEAKGDSLAEKLGEIGAL